MPTDVNVVSLLDLIAIVVGISSFLVTVLAFFASLRFFFAGQRLQDSANKTLAAVSEKTAAIDTRVGHLFDKTLEAALTGQQRSAQAPEPASVSLSADAQQLLSIASSPAVLEIEHAIRSDLDSKHLSVEEAKSVLIRHLAATRAALVCEVAYGLILGSQIAWLRRLNEARADGLDQQQLAAHFQEITGKYPDQYAGWTVEGYVKFLLDFRLLVHEDDRYRITPLGIEFLSWIARMGRTEQKLL